MLYPLLLVLGVVLSACGVGEAWEHEMLDEMTVHDGYPRINAAPYPSELGPPGVNVYCDPAWSAAYERIAPDQHGSGVRAPVEAQIVREVLDESGRVVRLTMMAKGPPGYDPTLGDWMFAVTDPDGVPVVDDGVVQLGRLAACHDCHADRAADDFLFGVPRTARPSSQ